MSPSEIEGMKRGIRLLSMDRVSVTHSGPIATGQMMTRTKCFGKFEVAVNRRRHQLRAFAKSRAGAWQAAVRWHKKLEKGVL